MSTVTRLCLGVCLVIGTSMTDATTVAQADVPVPHVTRLPAGPIGGPEHNYPFFATDIVLANVGYVEEEFAFDGAANVYGPPGPDGRVEVTERGVPYRTRMLVRRPARQARFNGIVLVEWLNVTNQYDTDVLWLYQKEFLVREGYAWVGVSAQNVGLSAAKTGLKAWSPARYGALDVTNNGAVTGDGLAADIFSQAGAAVRHVPEVLGGLKLAYVLAAGQSQSASRLGPYLNGPHFRAPVYDAAFLTVSNQAIRPDLTIPVIKVLSETERDSARRQPDQERVRVWPVTGATHSEQYSLLSRAAFLQRDLGLPAVDACTTPARSRVEIRYVYNAAVVALVRWLKAGTAPPHAPMFAYDETATLPEAASRGGRGGGSPEKPLQRDEFGNAKGGIRLSEIEVPVAKESAELCGLGGTHVPLDSETLNRLYPTHDDYVAKVTKVTQQRVAEGFLLPADARQTVAKAKASIYGRRVVCGTLCADERQFPSHPSSMLLANQTSYLMIRGGDALVAIVDRVTHVLAAGYAAGPGAIAREKFASASAVLQTFVARVHDKRARGDMAAETEALLVSQAETLRKLIGQYAAGGVSTRSGGL